jgi:hypothetical protein
MSIWQEGSQDEEGEGKEEAVKGEPSKGQFEVYERTCRTGALLFNEVHRSCDKPVKSCQTSPLDALLQVDRLISQLSFSFFEQE